MDIFWNCTICNVTNKRREGKINEHLFIRMHAVAHHKKELHAN